MALHVLDEANRCLGCKKPRCQQGCPIQTNIPEVIRLLKANKLDEAGRAKLGAVAAWVQPTAVEEVIQLCRNLEQFDFIPHIHSAHEYGKYMVRESGDYCYDAGLEGYIDYERFGQSLLFQETGQFVESGYVSYKGTLTLEEVMADDPAEQYRVGQGLSMSGM